MHVNRLPHAFMRLQDIKHGEVFSWADDEPPSVADVFMRCVDYAPSGHEVVVNLRSGRLMLAEPTVEVVPLNCVVDQR